MCELMNIYKKAQKLIVLYECSGEVLSGSGCGGDDWTVVGAGGEGRGRVIMENLCN